MKEKGETTVKQKVSNGHPILFSIMLGILITVLITIAFAVSAIFKFDKIETLIAQIVALLVMATIITVYMTTNGRTLSMFGFHKLGISKSKEVLYYIPLLVIAVVTPLIGGINTNLSLIEVICTIILMLIVGYTEESIFRGIIKEKLQSKGPAFYIIFSSVLFGILHMANGLNGGVLQAILQVANAMFIGIVLSQLITVIDNIIPLIAFHFIYNVFTSMTNINIDNKVTLILIILDSIYLLYSGYLLSIIKKKRIKLKYVSVQLQ